MDPQVIRDTIKNNKVLVIFEKASDGTLRHLIGSLDPQYLPKSEEDKVWNNHYEDKNSDVIRIWDLEKEAWRSFRAESVKSLSLYEEIENVLGN